MKYSGPRKLLSELSTSYSSFQYARRVYATAINFPFIKTLSNTIFKGTESVIISDPPCKDDNAHDSLVTFSSLSMQHIN